MLWCILWNGVHGDDGHESCTQIYTQIQKKKEKKGEKVWWKISTILLGVCCCCCYCCSIDWVSIFHRIFFIVCIHFHHFFRYNLWQPNGTIECSYITVLKSDFQTIMLILCMSVCYQQKKHHNHLPRSW